MIFVFLAIARGINRNKIGVKRISLFAKEGVASKPRQAEYAASTNRLEDAVVWLDVKTEKTS